MSAQAAAAFLSSSSRSSTASSVEADNSKSSPPPAKYTSTWKQQQQAESMDTKNNNPTTTKAIEELSRIRAGGSGGVASILSKFAAPPDRSAVKQQQQQQQQRPTSPSKSTVSNHDKPPTSPHQQATPARQQTTPQQRAPAPPRTTTTQVPARYLDRTASDMLAQELSAMYQEALDQHSAAQERLKELERDVEVYASDATKVRDYEIRVEYLAQKLEQISEERDALEQELKMYRERHGTLDTPTSPVFNQRLSQIFDKDRSEAGDKEHEQEPRPNGEAEVEEEDNDGEFYGLLDAYGDDGPEEERVSIQEDDRSSSSSHQTHTVSRRQLEALKKQLRACDEGAKMAMQQYVASLERERLESKALRDVVRKQDELINTLEQQITHKSETTTGTPVVSRPPRGASLAISTDKKVQQKDHPPMPAGAASAAEHQQLREQLESQGRELEDKRALLTQLLNEREEYMKQSGRSNTSSIDVLAEMAKPPARSHSRNNNNNTPPPSAPPRDPLPPVPAHQLQNVMSPSKSSRGSMASLHDESGLSSSVTSWSSSDFGRHMHKQQQQHPHPQPKANEFENMYANYLQEGGSGVDEDENAALEHHREALRRLENTHDNTKKPADEEPYWHSLMA